MLFLCLLFMPFASSTTIGDLANNSYSDDGSLHANVSVSVYAMKNSGGEWYTAFEALKMLDNITTGIKFDLKKSVVHSQGKKYLRLNGVIKDLDPLKNEGITKHEDFEETHICPCFHRRTQRFDFEIKGNNIELSNDFRTAKRTDPTNKDRHGTIILNRPLHIDEMFEIRIDESIGKWRNYSLGIGVITHPSKEIQSRELMYRMTNGTWSVAAYDATYGFSCVRKDNNILSSDFPLQLRNVNDDNLLGLMRRRNGDVHLFKNGKDMGVAMRQVPSGVFPYFEVIEYVTKVTLVS